MGFINEDHIYNAFAKHLYQVRIRGSSLQQLYPTIELAYHAGYLGTTKPYNDFHIKVEVAGEPEKFLFKINASDRDWFKDLNDRVARRLGKPHVTVQLNGQALNQVSLYNVVHNNRNTVYSVAYVQADIPVYTPSSLAASSSTSSSSKMLIEKEDLPRVIKEFLEIAFNALIDDIHGNSNNKELTIEEWISEIRNYTHTQEFIYNYYRAYSVQINDSNYLLSDVFAQHRGLNQAYLLDSFIKISVVFTKNAISYLNKNRDIDDRHAALPIIKAVIKRTIDEYGIKTIYRSIYLSNDKKTFLPSSSSSSQKDDDDESTPIASQLRFIGVKFNIPLPSLRKTKNVLQNTKNVVTNVKSRSKFVEFSLASSVSKGRVSTLIQNAISEVEPGDILQYRILPGTEPQWVRVDIEENRADYRGNFPRESWKIVTSNKIRRPASVAMDAPHMTFPLAWAKYRVRVYIERKDAPGRWKQEGERNFNCSVKGGKTGNEFTWAQLREVLANRDLWDKLGIGDEIQHMRVSNRPPFVYRELEGGPVIASFPENAEKCLQSAWEIDEEKQEDDSVALVFWSDLKTYSGEKKERILRARRRIWARFNNARLDTSRYDAPDIDHPFYEEEYANAPVTAKGECPYDKVEDSVGARFSSLPPLASRNIGFRDFGLSKTQNLVAQQSERKVDLPRAKKAAAESQTLEGRRQQENAMKALTNVATISIATPATTTTIPGVAVQRQRVNLSGALKRRREIYLIERPLHPSRIEFINTEDNELITSDAELLRAGENVQTNIVLPIFKMNYLSSREVQVEKTDDLVVNKVTTRFIVEDKKFATFAEFIKEQKEGVVISFLRYQNDTIVHVAPSETLYRSLSSRVSDVCGMVFDDVFTRTTAIDTLFATDYLQQISHEQFVFEPYVFYTIFNETRACKESDYTSEKILAKYVASSPSVDLRNIKVEANQGPRIVDVAIQILALDISSATRLQSVNVSTRTPRPLSEVLSSTNNVFYYFNGSRLQSLANAESTNEFIERGVSIVIISRDDQRIPPNVDKVAFDYVSTIRSFNHGVLQTGSPFEYTNVQERQLTNLVQELRSIVIVNNGAASSSSNAEATSSNDGFVSDEEDSDDELPTAPALSPTLIPASNTSIAGSSNGSGEINYVVTGGYSIPAVEGSSPEETIISYMNEQVVTRVPRSAISVIKERNNEYVVNVDIAVRIAYTTDVDTFTTKMVTFSTNNRIKVGNDVPFSPTTPKTYIEHITGIFMSDLQDKNSAIKYLTLKPFTDVKPSALISADIYAVLIVILDVPVSQDANANAFVENQATALIESYRDADVNDYKQIFAVDAPALVNADINANPPRTLKDWIAYYGKYNPDPDAGALLPNSGAYLIFLPSDTRQIEKAFAAGRLDAFKYIEDHVVWFEYSESFARHKRKLDPIIFNGRKLIIRRRGFNSATQMLDMSIETADGYIYNVAGTIYVDEPKRLVVSIPSSDFLDF